VRASLDEIRSSLAKIEAHDSRQDARLDAIEAALSVFYSEAAAAAGNEGST
jgi:hypothetical protein